MHDAEDRGVRADTERQSHQGGDREPGGRNSVRMPYRASCINASTTGRPC